MCLFGFVEWSVRSVSVNRRLSRAAVTAVVLGLCAPSAAYAAVEPPPPIIFGDGNQVAGRDINNTAGRDNNIGSTVDVVPVTSPSTPPVGGVGSQQPQCTATGACSLTYRYTGEDRVFVVPDNANSFTVTLTGAGGGGNDPSSSASNASGGRGSVLRATIPITAQGVAPDEILTVVVGGRGGTGGGYTGGRGGYNGGGNGGDLSPQDNDYVDLVGAGGGGASDIRSVPPSQPGSLAARLLVAAGGGGGGAPYTGLSGGEGGAGDQRGNGSRDGADPGGPGTQTAGGVPGNPAANPAGFGTFGRGGDAPTVAFSSPGGGGGGYYGGGAGGWIPTGTYRGAGGGGGSSFFSDYAAQAGRSLSTATTYEPSVVITWQQTSS
ncbi:hypothetical protein C6N75_10600 [Streptomyces solincola]|uniref:receptor protein-tyrosine kinase n=1 Tax=Streptomyces solincola TaxID=2100817 RepID=A0A2S9PY20_9ACTN|nr:hypothetical protein C6N75_10600 [Streptomyces solincola]